MEIRQLEMLCAVAEQEGYLNAANYLGISHSAIHRQIRMLEEELGDKLFVRRGHMVHLTEAGKLMVAFAHRALQDVKTIEQQIQNLKSLPSHV